MQEPFGETELDANGLKAVELNLNRYGPYKFREKNSTVIE